MMNLFNLVSACAVAVLGGYQKPHLDNHKNVPYVETSSYRTFTISNDYAYCLYDYYNDNNDFDGYSFLIYQFYDLDVGTTFLYYETSEEETFQSWSNSYWDSTITLSNLKSVANNGSLALYQYELIFFTFCVPETLTDLVDDNSNLIVDVEISGTEFFSFCLLNDTLHDYGVNVSWTNNVNGTAFVNNQFVYWPNGNLVKIGCFTTNMVNITSFNNHDDYSTSYYVNLPSSTYYSSYLNYYFYFFNYNSRMPVGTYQQWYFYSYYLQCGSFETYYTWIDDSLLTPRNQGLISMYAEYKHDKTFRATLLNGVYNNQAIYDDGYQNGYNEGFNNGYTDGNNDGYAEGHGEGYTDGYSDGSNQGYDVGYDVGYQDGMSTGSHYSFGSLFGAIADTPILMIRSLFDFDFFGVNLLSVVLSLFTGLILFYLLRKLL